MQLKEPLTYDEQLLRLEKVHNLIIYDKDRAKNILSKVNYYRLSGYGIGLTKDNDRDKYIEGISLEHLYKLYQFDSSFRNMLIHVIEQIEIQLRTQIANFLALKYGAEGYIKTENFNDKMNKQGESIHNIIIQNFKKECSRQSNAPFVKHHMSKYEGHFPVWVAVELFTFGNIASLYSIMKKEDQKEISKLYNTEAKYLGSWILSLVEIRNICAHYGRLYNMPLKQAPHLYPENRKYKADNLNKVFPPLLVIKRLLNADSLWVDFYQKIRLLINSHNDVVNLDFMGFPADWEVVLK